MKRASFRLSRQSARSLSVIILWVGGGEAMHRLVGLGTLFAFIEYAKMFFLPLRDVSSKYTVLQSALASAERLEELMREPVKIESPAHPHTPAVKRGRIVFDNVRFLLPARRAGAQGTQLHHRTRSEDRDRRRHRLGKIHHHQAAQPLL